MFWVTGTATGQTTILQENFDNGFPTGWQRIDLDGFTVHPTVSHFTQAWIVGNDADSAATDSTVISTSWYNPAGASEDFLITPRLQMGAYGNYIYWEARSEDPSWPDSYVVLLSSTDSLTGSFVDTLTVVNNESPDWTGYAFCLDSIQATGKSVFVAFKNISNDKFILHLDNIAVTVNDPVNVLAVKKPSLKVFPNPANDFLYISGEYSQNTVFNLFDATGALVRTFHGAGRHNLQGLSDGFYLLSAEDSQLYGVTKVLIQNSL